MTKVLVTEDYLGDIADAIRAKNGGSDTYTPGQMAGAIAALPDAPVLVAKTITANGEYDPEDDNADGYSGVVVSVPNSYSQSDEGKVVSNGALVAQTSRTVTQNGTYDTTENDEVVVSVSGGGSTLITKNITQNGTYNASSDNADGYSQVTVNVSGGGLIEEWDLTQSVTGKIRGIVLTNSGVTIGNTGAVFDSTNNYLRVEFGFNSITIEVDVASMNLSAGTHRRFIMATDAAGLIYRSTGKWSFYGSGTWATDSSITDGSFFDDSTVKVVIDVNGYWHIYKNDVLVYEPNIPLAPKVIWVGSSGTSINNAVISGLRVY